MRQLVELRGVLDEDFLALILDFHLQWSKAVGPVFVKIRRLRASKKCYQELVF